MPRPLLAVVAVLVVLGLAAAAWYVADRTDPSPTTDGPLGYGEGPFDPVAYYGPHFVDWPKPRLALVITGQQDGYLEPCGCAGLDRMKGGLARRHALLEELKADGWPTVAIDNGGLVRRFGPQAETKLEYASEALHTLDYDAVGLGFGELRLPAASLLVAVGDRETTPFLSANVGLFGLDADMTPKFQIVEQAGLRIGVTSILGDAYREQLQNADVETIPAADALAEVVPALDADADVLVLLSHAPREESIALARAFPQFDVVVTAGGAEEPPPEPEWIDDGDTDEDDASARRGTMLIEVGHKGMYAAVVGFYDDEQTPTRYQRVTLDARYQETPEMHQMMVDYQAALEVQGLARLVGAPRRHPQSDELGDLRGTFVGSKRCGECHTLAYEIWSKTGHAHATQSLVEANPPRQFDPECLSCHATGWHPQEFTPYATGYVDQETTPLLVGNGCENCHGPGAAHVAAETERPVDLARRTEWRDVMKLSGTNVEENVCLQCHDLDNSPSFKYDVYWPKIRHRGTQ